MLEQGPMQAGGCREPPSQVGPGDVQLQVAAWPKAHCGRERRPVTMGLLCAGRGGAHFSPQARLYPTSGTLHKPLSLSATFSLKPSRLPKIGTALFYLVVYHFISPIRISAEISVCLVATVPSTQ